MQVQLDPSASRRVCHGAPTALLVSAQLLSSSDGRHRRRRPAASKSLRWATGLSDDAEEPCLGLSVGLCGRATRRQRSCRAQHPTAIGPFVSGYRHATPGARASVAAARRKMARLGGAHEEVAAS
jgi:hypothetical protein